jgi:uncharacterized protein with PQ loop repeat
MASESFLYQLWLYFATNELLAHTAGVFSSLCFLLQYVPQIVWNYSRKSVRGFSAVGIIMKLVGASFLLINALLTGENSAVVLYGLCNVVQHSIFMFQFSTYTHDDSHKSEGDLKELPQQSEKGSVKEAFTERKEQFLAWLFFPILPIFMGFYFPETMYFTNSIKPFTQVISHLPQLKVCWQLKTTNGVSLTSQHLNFVGGIAGLYMCLVLPPVHSTTYLIYVNSILQALSLYALAVYYDGWLFHKQFKSIEQRNV